MSGRSPLSSVTDRRYYGVVPAVVAPFPDDKEDSSQEGRVWLRFPWFDSRMATGPCRVAQLYAGNGYGAMWRPEVGDEVLVGFVHGEMRDPIVIGGLYNGKDKPFTHPDKQTDQKAFVTKAGHRIVFDDKANSVTIATKDDHRIVLDDKAKSVTIANKSGTSITLDGDGKNVTISADAKLTLKARDIELTAKGGDVTVKGEKIRLN